MILTKKEISYNNKSGLISTKLCATVINTTRIPGKKECIITYRTGVYSLKDSVHKSQVFNEDFKTIGYKDLDAARTIVMADKGIYIKEIRADGTAIEDMVVEIALAKEFNLGDKYFGTDWEILPDENIIFE